MPTAIARAKTEANKRSGPKVTNRDRANAAKEEQIPAEEFCLRLDGLIAGRTFRDWQEQGKLAPTVAGKIPTWLWVKQIIQHYQGTEDELREVKIRVETARANKLEMQNDELSGQLVRVEVVKNSWISALATCRASLRALSSSLAESLDGIESKAKRQEIILTEIDFILTQLAKGSND
jgi:phage terminase Nu1 subunit (DNA packaging protein)